MIVAQRFGVSGVTYVGLGLKLGQELLGGAVALEHLNAGSLRVLAVEKIPTKKSAFQLE